jgi:hypothetical protein
MTRLFACAALVLAVLIPSPSWAGELAPHKAEYALGLKSAKQGSGIAGLKGSMSFTFADSCDGWAMENKTVMVMQQAEGDEIESRWSFLTWEAKDGLSYRFRVNSWRDGEKVEEIEGSATLEAAGGPGKAILTKPESKTIRLPRGTLFPAAHTRLLLAEAARGKNSFQRLVFDGSSLDSPQEVSALIGSAKPAPPKSASGLAAHPLLAHPSWPSHMAFFKTGGKDGLPSYEISLRYFDNGIADDVIEDYGNFTVRSTLSKLEPLPRPDC